MDRSPARDRSREVIFNFNGHSWDAYEVLGVPAGSSFESVRRAYETNLTKLDSTSRSFLEAAYLAIEKTTSRK